MSNKGIREKKRKQERKRKARNKKIFRGSALSIAAVVAIFNFGIKGDNDDFQITRPSEYRQASGNFSELEEEVKEDTNDKIHVATDKGFSQASVDKKHSLEDDKYQDTLVSYVLCQQTQYAYQYPNDYSKTEKYIKKGSYVPYYGTENGFSKVKIDDTYYYVNKFGLSKLDSDKQIKVVNGITYVNESNPLPDDFDPGVDKTARRSFETMRQDMSREGLNIKIASDYRGYELEEKMHEANEPDSSKAGTNEHQTGQAFDFFTEGSKYNDKFEKSAEYEWLSKNAYKYGFIERYPKEKENKTGHKAEAWHFRFVGAENAKNIYENDLTLEEYLKLN
ncbi:M15 family metallopeptidase [uncultured Anaerococcus sp.]|uniref:M15 family metallopeptidase n=1 Tax=uncultured Anaerococcus sp. TaxID=293428 RepID=UPI00261ECB7E|nr:M15 family metallopeptidase [uncultured Anaerococcus sp.]